MRREVSGSDAGTDVGHLVATLEPVPQSPEGGGDREGWTRGPGDQGTRDQGTRGPGYT